MTRWNVFWAPAEGPPVSARHLMKHGYGSRPYENSNARAAVYEFQSIFGVFGHYGLGRAKKFAPDAPFSEDFRVFTQAGSYAVLRTSRPSPVSGLNRTFGSVATGPPTLGCGFLPPKGSGPCKLVRTPPQSGLIFSVQSIQSRFPKVL